MDSLAWFQLANKHCFLFLTVLKPERDGRETLVILIVYVEFEADRDEIARCDFHIAERVGRVVDFQSVVD